jgi:hypothetical protein
MRVRIPNCTCVPHVPTLVSPLFQVRWKRLVIDEGHVSGTIVTDLSTFANTLSVERRWIVSGTPTAHLLGLSLGQASGMVDGDDEAGGMVDGDDKESEVERLLNDQTEVQARVWTSAERADFPNLAKMMHYFLQMPVFHHPDTFDKLVVTPLFNSTGPAPGAVSLFTQVLQSIMLRHR